VIKRPSLDLYCGGNHGLKVQEQEKVSENAWSWMNGNAKYSQRGWKMLISTTLMDEEGFLQPVC
jgi:hypothetical protein